MHGSRMVLDLQLQPEKQASSTANYVLQIMTEAGKPHLRTCNIKIDLPAILINNMIT
jgi:hypothetical protein